ncbi:MAG: tRNA uridine-5-carboxymethylaminomethyl(34) synthesis GTPase MnmE [Schleiferiaceae bacterium]|nr:tRNA uridine-5-carboxymethylaminomethyl(34) synthesis GTPase MnmE [Schleiferiaceae bacterium]
MNTATTICAIATAPGMGAIAVIRLSGTATFDILSKVFKKGKRSVIWDDVPPYSMLYGSLYDGTTLIDDVVVGIFKGGKSYTGEDTAEISCHGSVYIQQRIIDLLLQNGATLAGPGEFSMRAFANGKMDLSQAEAVADLIFSESAAAHNVAIQQMRGGFSKRLQELREKLINFVALIELELDFGEEDVEFANRTELQDLLQAISAEVKKLAASFQLGNAIKNGLPVAIVGPPNAGKSTLLNALLQEDKALVSDIAGTTRDAIEDEITLEGVRFRFIDTAGIRETTDVVENMGIQKTYAKIKEAAIALLLFDASDTENHAAILETFQALQAAATDTTFILVANKIDRATAFDWQPWTALSPHRVTISALAQTGLDELTTALVAGSGLQHWQQADIIVSNSRHKQALLAALAALQATEEGITQGLSGDLLAFHLRDALKSLGEITGHIDVDRDILGTIFGKFCIGK